MEHTGEPCAPESRAFKVNISGGISSDALPASFGGGSPCLASDVTS